MSTSILKLSDLGVQLAHKQIVHGISLTIEAGEKVAVLGPNGSGKSTLLRSIAGLIRDYQGSALLAGKELKTFHVDDLARTISLVPQRIEYVPRFSVEEFLELSRTAGSEAITGLEHLYTRFLPELSGGELQRVVLAAAVYQGARLLLLDEPTAHLDPRGREDVQGTLDSYHHNSGFAYILVTHDVALAQRLAERIVLMQAGRIVWDGPASSAELPALLGEVYGAKFARFVDPEGKHSFIAPG